MAEDLRLAQRRGVADSGPQAAVRLPGPVWVDEARLLAACRRDPVLHAVRPGEAFSDRGVHRALLKAYYGPHQERLLEHLRADPLYLTCRDAWQPGSQAWEANVALFHAMFDRMSAAMGAIYRFTPAPLGHSEALPHWAAGLYSPAEQRILISQRLLTGGPAEIMATIGHEQIHRFQHVQRQRLAAGRLGGLEASFAAFWAIEEAARTPGPALHLGTEHQAYLLDREITRAFLHLDRRGDRA